MTVTFEGIITRNNGAQPAAGTVAITPDGGETTTETLDPTGSIPSGVEIAGTSFTIVETYTSGPTLTSTVRCIDGQTIDLSKDVGSADPTQTKTGAMQTFANAGAPSGTTAPGSANGDIYIRLDAVHGTNDTFYQKQAGAWVGLA